MNGLYQQKGEKLTNGLLLLLLLNQSIFILFLNLKISVFLYRLGIPLILIIGKKACDPENPLFELYITKEDKTCFLPMNELLEQIANIFNENTFIDDTF